MATARRFFKMTVSYTAPQPIPDEMLTIIEEAESAVVTHDPSAHEEPEPVVSSDIPHEPVDIYPAPPPDGPYLASVNTFGIRVPKDDVYSHSSLEIRLVKGYRSTAWIKSEPAEGHTGDGEIEVGYYVPFGESLEFTIRAYCVPHERSLKIIDFSWTPDPAVAGQPAVCTSTVKSTGNVFLGRARLQVEAYAVSLDDDLLDLIESASDKERTTTPFNDVVELSIDPGEKVSVSVDVPIQERIKIPKYHINWSTAGSYRITVRFLWRGMEIGSREIQNFRIVKAGS